MLVLGRMRIVAGKFCLALMELHTKALIVLDVSVQVSRILGSQHWSQEEKLSLSGIALNTNVSKNSSKGTGKSQEESAKAPLPTKSNSVECLKVNK